MSALFDTSIYLQSGATFSPNRLYRYSLWRVWDDSLSFLNVIGLNPSVADERNDDPTIRRCLDFARRWGYGGLYMTNLFAFRATDPIHMLRYSEPVGMDNNSVIGDIAVNSGMVLCAWGKDGVHQGRQAYVMDLLSDHKLYCLGENKNRTPKHPLYIAAETKPRIFRERVKYERTT